MRAHLHINFGGQCEAAFRFYEQCLLGRIVTMLTWRNSPMVAATPPGWHDKICHATLILGEDELAGVDDPFEQAQPPRGFQILLEIDQADEAERIFQALAENGTVKSPLQTTFWSARFGALIDQFGVPWEINCVKTSAPELPETPRPKTPK